MSEIPYTQQSMCMLNWFLEERRKQMNAHTRDERIAFQMIVMHEENTTQWNHW